MKTITEYDNVVFYIGKDAKENHVLLDTTEPDDIWFHYNGNPSAHVYLRVNPGYQLSKKELQKMIKVGALLVRQNSKKISGLVEICYEKRKNIRKGSNPGEVILLNDPKIIEI